MPISELIFSLTLIALLIVVVSTIIIDFVNYLRGQPPFLPSTKREVKGILEIYKFKKDDKVVDLGCGDARILIKLADIGINSVGFDINPFLVTYGKLLVMLKGKSKKIKIYRKNYLNADFSKYNVFIIYGMKTTMAKLEIKLLREAGKGSVVVCNRITFPNLKHTKRNDTAYLYKL